MALRHMEPFFATPISAISPRDILNSAQKFRDKGAYLNLYRTVWSRVINHAFEMGYIDRPIPVPLKTMRVNKRRPWDSNSLDVIVKEPRTLVERVMCIGYFTAQRVGDILNMKWSDYDGQSIMVSQQKTKVVVRIPTTATLKKMLDNLERNGPYIIQSNGKQVKYVGFERRFRAEFPTKLFPSFHTIRHAAATRLAAIGATPHEIMSITGHKTLQSVQRYTQDAYMWANAQRIMARFEE